MNLYQIKAILYFSTLILFSLPSFAQTADESRKRVKLYLEQQIEEYEDLIKINPDQKDRLEQLIVRNLIYADAPSEKILERIGKGFQKPEKRIYFEIAHFLVNRREYLDRALEFLRLEAAVPYIYSPNDAYSPPCLWCLEAEIYFQQKQYQKVIDSIEPNVPAIQPIVPVGQSFGNIDFKILALSYIRTKRLDKAVNLYLKIVSETVYPNAENKKLLTEFYQKKYGSLDGLEEKITEENKLWRYDVFIKPNLVNIPAPQITIFDIYGKQVSLSDYSGKILVVLFYPVSSENIKRILKLIEKKDVVFIALDSDYETWENYRKIFFSVEQRREKILAKLDVIKSAFPILLADNSNFDQLKKNLGFMVSIIDRRGNIRFRNVPEGEPYFSERLNYLLDNISR